MSKRIKDEKALEKAEEKKKLKKERMKNQKPKKGRGGYSLPCRLLRFILIVETAQYADISSGMLCASACRINNHSGLPWPKMPGPFFGPSPALGSREAW